MLQVEITHPDGAVKEMQAPDESVIGKGVVEILVSAEEGFSPWRSCLGGFQQVRGQSALSPPTVEIVADRESG